MNKNDSTYWSYWDFVIFGAILKTMRWSPSTPLKKFNRALILFLLSQVILFVIVFFGVIFDSLPLWAKEHIYKPGEQAILSKITLSDFIAVGLWLAIAGISWIIYNQLFQKSHLKV